MVIKSNWKISDLPPKGGWAKGDYLQTCPKCGDKFQGDKRAIECADCAYETDTLTPEELREIEERISQDDVAISHGMRTEVDPADYFEIAEQLLAHIRATQKQNVYLYNCGYHAGHEDTVEGNYTDVYTCDMKTYHSDVVAEILQEQS